MPILRKQLLDSSRGRIVALLSNWRSDRRRRRHPAGPHQECDSRPNHGDGARRRGPARGPAAGATRPSHVFELTPEVEQLLSSVYIPLLSQLIAVFSEGLPTPQLEALLRKAEQGSPTTSAVAGGRPETSALGSRP